MHEHTLWDLVTNKVMSTRDDYTRAGAQQQAREFIHKMDQWVGNRYDIADEMTRRVLRA